jgi:hypothetical protein
MRRLAPSPNQVALVPFASPPADRMRLIRVNAIRYLLTAPGPQTPAAIMSSLPFLRIVPAVPKWELLKVLEQMCAEGIAEKEPFEQFFSAYRLADLYDPSPETLS